MKVVFSYHANLRLSQDRQKGVTREQVISLARSFKPRVHEKSSLKISRGNLEIAISDKNGYRLIITVIKKRK